METNTLNQKLCYGYVSKEEVKTVTIQTLVTTKSLAVGSIFGKLIISDGLLLPCRGLAFSANLWFQLINAGSTYVQLLWSCHEKILFRTETFSWLPKRIHAPFMAILHLPLARNENPPIKLVL